MTADKQSAHTVPADFSVGGIAKPIWLLLASFIILGFLDSVTTLVAYSVSGGFVELNSFASPFFRMGFQGFMLADVTKYLPVPPLIYMAALRTGNGAADDQVTLLKIAAFAVLLVADGYLTLILVANNVPILMNFF